MHSPKHGLLALVAAVSLAACASSAPTPIASAVAVADAQRAGSACVASPLDVPPFRLGALDYSEGIVLDAVDARVGGLSALAPYGADGFLAISDQGRVIEIRLARDDTDKLTAWCGVHALGDAAGQPLDDKTEADSEGVAWLDDEHMLVSFERHHRVQTYRVGPDITGTSATLAPVGAALEFSGAEGLEDNQGLEALALLNSGAILAGGESATLLGRPHPVWRLAPPDEPTASFTAPGAPAFEIASAPGYGLVSFDVTPRGDVIVVQRFFQQDLGNAIMIQRIPRATAETATDLVQPELLATLTRSDPLPVDNFEAVATRAGDNGGLELWILSDDNFSAGQRTLLYRFSLEEHEP